MSSKLSKNLEVRKQQMRRRREKRRERIRTDVVYRKRHNRQKSLSHKYGINLDDFATLQEAYGNDCNICSLGPAPDQNLDIDHNHTTGHIRGLLCRHCNVGIGHFKEDIRLLQRAIEYLIERDNVQR